MTAKLKPEDMIGNIYGQLTVVSYIGTKRGRSIWGCLCSCGKETPSNASNLKQGVKKSCGCINHKKKHGLCGTPEYAVWTDMKTRCLKSNYKRYMDYGGRGITICDHWLNSFENFYADMGKRPSASFSIDRIDNDGDYDPSNCKWSTRSEQEQNKRSKGQLMLDRQPGGES